MINKDVQEVSCDKCDKKKVCHVTEEMVPEGWILVDIKGMHFGLKPKDKNGNTISELFPDPIHLCSLGCFTEYFTKVYEKLREKSMNGHKSLATIVDPSVAEPELTTEIFFKKE